MKDAKLLTYIAKKVKKLREDRNMSQADVFNDTGIHIGRIEVGDRDISISTVRAVCNYFDLSISDFFSDLK
jgi:transcriptional regulator with XRE-family HTH domain